MSLAEPVLRVRRASARGSGSDGPDATGCFFLGGRSVIPQIEPLEAQYPIVRRVRPPARPTPAAPGRWRGGLGVELCVELTAAARLTVRGDRMLGPPPGALGGGPGVGGSVRGRSVPTGPLRQLATRQQAVALAPGDVLRAAHLRGGGLGDPLARDRPARRRRRGRGPVSVTEGASDDYGVVLDADGAVDDAATLRRRAGRPA